MLTGWTQSLIVMAGITGRMSVHAGKLETTYLLIFRHNGKADEIIDAVQQEFIQDGIICAKVLTETVVIGWEETTHKHIG